MNTRAKAKKAKRAEAAKLEDCAICMCAIELPVVACEGMHHYHRECLNGWISNDSTSCPSCRQPIDQKLIDGAPITTEALFEMIRDRGDPHAILGRVKMQKLHFARLPEYPRYGLLHVACMYNHWPLLTLFSKEPLFDFEVRDDDGNTPLHHSINVLGSSNCAKILLLDVKVKPDMLNFYGDTPLHLLCNTGSVNTLVSLKKRATENGELCVDFNRRNRVGSSPLEIAILDKAPDFFISCLLGSGLFYAHGVNVNVDSQLMEATRGDGGTAIMRAAWMGRKKTIEILLEASPDRNASLLMKDRSGQTAVDYAVDQGHHELATWLREELRKATNGEN